MRISSNSIESIVQVDGDRYGDTLRALLYDGDDVYYATRRDDSYISDGGKMRRPEWNVKKHGDIQLVRVAGSKELQEWMRQEPQEFRSWVLGGIGLLPGGEELRVEDLNADRIELYDDWEHRDFEVEYEIS